MILALRPPEASAAKGGILADEMGMGKTIQAIGERFKWVKSEQQLPGTFRKKAAETNVVHLGLS